MTMLNVSCFLRHDLLTSELTALLWKHDTNYNMIRDLLKVQCHSQSSLKSSHSQHSSIVCRKLKETKTSRSGSEGR